MRVLLTLAFLIFLLAVNSCRSTPSNPDLDIAGIRTINLETSSLESISIDSIATNVRAVILETTPESLIENYDDIIIMDDKIFVLSSSRTQKVVFIFDIEGHFLGKIDAVGRGPAEYADIMTFYIDPVKEQIGIVSLLKLLVYDYHGTFLYSHSFEETRDMIWFNDKIYLVISETTPFRPGSEKISEFNIVRIFDSDLNMLMQTYPVNRALFAPHASGTQKNSFVIHRTDLYFKHRFSDVIYKVDNLSFEPEYLLDYGRHKVDDFKEIIDKMNKAPHLAIENYLIPNDLHYPGGTRFSLTNDHIWFTTAIGWSLQEVLYDVESGNSILVNKSKSVKDGNITNVRPNDIRAYRDEFFGYLTADQILFFENGNYEHCPSSSLSPLNINGLDEISLNDNAVIVFFDIKEDFLK